MARAIEKVGAEGAVVVEEAKATETTRSRPHPEPRWQQEFTRVAAE